MSLAHGLESTRQHHRPALVVWAARRLYRSKLLNAQHTSRRAISTSTGDALCVRTLTCVFPAGMHGACRGGVVAGQQGLAVLDATPALSAEVLEAVTTDDTAVT